MFCYYTAKILCYSLNSLDKLDIIKESEKQAKSDIPISNKTPSSFVFNLSKPGSVRFLNPAIVDALLKDFNPFNTF